MKIDDNTRIGWIGCGVMGGQMARHLLEGGYLLTVHSRTRSKSQFLLDAGAAWASSPAEVAKNSDIVFTMVGFPSDVRDVVLGTEGIVEGWNSTESLSDKSLKSGRRVYVDMTTSSPELARKLAQIGESHDIDILDAPVSGGDIGAKNGTLSIMIGGRKEIADDLMPLWQLMGNNIVWQGPAGNGQHTKMVNQILIAGAMIGLCESFLYAYSAGLDMEKVLQSVSSGAAGSWSLSNMGPRILAGNYEPGFYVEHFVKDMGIALEEARRVNLSLPGLALVQQLYIALMGQGGGRLGTQALIKALATLSGKQNLSPKQH